MPDTLRNVMSLAPKVDELRHVVKYASLDLVCSSIV